MKLHRVFFAATLLLLSLITLMLSHIVYTEWQAWRSAGQGLHAMRLAHMAMLGAEKASFERGPSNGVLGDAVPPDPAKRERLMKARAVSDKVLNDLLALIENDADPHRRMSTESLHKARGLLGAARANLDSVAALPLEQRTPDAVMGAVQGMFDVIPVLMEAVALLSRHAEQIHPQFSDDLVAARFATELREYAGRLGSQFTVALTTRQPLAEPQQRAILMLRGRIEQLRGLIGTVARVQRGGAPEVAAATRVMESEYFGRGLAFVETVEQASAARLPYPVDAAGFAARYQPPMASIVALRDALVNAAIAGAQASQRQARQSLIAIVSVGAFTMLAVLALFFIIRRRVLVPLLRGTGVLNRLAHGDLDTIVPQPHRNDEIGGMFAAIATLKERSLEKQRLETERQRLFTELDTVSKTDFLTGLLNRRAFVEAATAHIANAKRHQRPYALILFDIDHFKSINDTWGHDAGDDALVKITNVAKQQRREGDLLARFGGEEFVILAADCETGTAVAVAERVRAALEAERTRMTGGEEIRITASFGVATGTGHADENLDAMLRMADQALFAAKRGGRNRIVLHGNLPPAGTPAGLPV